MTGVGIGLGGAMTCMAAHVVTCVRIGWGRLGWSHGVARMGISCGSAVPCVAAHIVTGMRIGRRGVVICVRASLGGVGRSHVVTRVGIRRGRLGRSHVVAGMGISRSGAVPGVTAHVMTSVRVRLSAGGGSMHGAGLALTHHGAVVRRLGGRGRRLCGGSRCGNVSRMTGVALGQGGTARSQHQRRERQGEGKRLHEAAPASGRTVTTLNMPACMCIRRWQWKAQSPGASAVRSKVTLPPGATLTVCLSG